MCAGNHRGVKVLAYLAVIAPSGRSPKNPMTHRIACVRAVFSNGKRGIWISTWGCSTMVAILNYKGVRVYVTNNCQRLDWRMGWIDESDTLDIERERVCIMDLRIPPESFSNLSDGKKKEWVTKCPGKFGLTICVLIYCPIFTFIVRVRPAQHEKYEGEGESRAWRKMQTAKLTQGRFAARE